jgi:3-methyladenine DNA glycosylase AlkD
MSAQFRSFSSAVRADLAAAAQPSRAAGMQAYLKSAMPCRGVAMPVLRQIVRARAAEFPVTSRAEWRRVTLDLWQGAAFREERHAAIEFVRLPRFAAYRRPAAIPMVAKMIVSGAWWDLVDPLATDVLGDILRAAPEVTAARMRAWSRDPNLWKRRASILCQIGFKADTDLRLLYDCIEPNLGDRDFFIRKAIGWALRQYAWTDPEEVARYVGAHRARLSALSVREALKNVRAE